MTKFIHIRNHTWDNTVLSTGGITIAYNFDPETRQATYYYSKCADSDHYNKKIGRAITSGRLAKYGGTTFEVEKDRHVAASVVRHLMNTKYGYREVDAMDALEELLDSADAEPSATDTGH